MLFLLYNNEKSGDTERSCNLSKVTELKSAGAWIPVRQFGSIVVYSTAAVLYTTLEEGDQQDMVTECVEKTQFTSLHFIMLL